VSPRDWLARFEPRGDRLQADLEALVGLESPSDDPERVSSLARWVRDRLRGCGVRAETRACPPRGDALVARVGNGGRGSLLLGHLDTVWPAGTLGDFPFRVEGDRASGPGAFDMKAGIAVAIAVLGEVAAQGGGDASLLLVPDEEVGSAASRALTLELAERHARVLVLEPSLDGAAKIARKGNGAFELRFRGRAAHAGLDPERGASALAELARCVLFLETLADASKGTTVAGTVARSGDRTNVIPEDGTLRVDVRIWSQDEAERVTRAIRGYRPADDRVEVSVDGSVDRPPLEPTPASLALYETARRVGAELGLELDAARVGGASDGNFTAAAGIPTLDGLGPRGGGAHARGEFVSLSDLPARAALVAALVTDAGA
jgi:glutamate carboxypeptidase